MRKFERNAILIVAEITLTRKSLLLVFFFIFWGHLLHDGSVIQNNFFGFKMNPFFWFKATSGL